MYALSPLSLLHAPYDDWFHTHVYSAYYYNSTTPSVVPRAYLRELVEGLDQVVGHVQHGEVLPTTTTTARRRQEDDKVAGQEEYKKSDESDLSVSTNRVNGVDRNAIVLYSSYTFQVYTYFKKFSVYA